MAVRSRYAEDQLVLAVERGVRQYIVLGAGLDPFAYRNPYAEIGLRVLEVDHPATQAWKRELLGAAGIPIPPQLTFVPIDFERQTLRDTLPIAGFDAAAPAFFSWLGVTNARYFHGRTDDLRVIGGLGHLLSAQVGAKS